MGTPKQSLSEKINRYKRSFSVPIVRDDKIAFLRATLFAKTATPTKLASFQAAKHSQVYVHTHNSQESLKMCPYILFKILEGFQKFFGNSVNNTDIFNGRAHDYKTVLAACITIIFICLFRRLFQSTIETNRPYKYNRVYYKMHSFMCLLARFTKTHTHNIYFGWKNGLRHIFRQCANTKPTQLQKSFIARFLGTMWQRRQAGNTSLDLELHSCVCVCVCAPEP